MGYLVHAFSYVKVAIKDNFNNNEKEYKPILDIVVKHWALHFDDRPLLSVGAFLNPMVYYKEREENNSLLISMRPHFKNTWNEWSSIRTNKMKSCWVLIPTSKEEEDLVVKW